MIFILWLVTQCDAIPCINLLTVQRSLGGVREPDSKEFTFSQQCSLVGLPGLSNHSGEGGVPEVFSRAARRPGQGLQCNVREQYKPLVQIRCDLLANKTRAVIGQTIGSGTMRTRSRNWQFLNQAESRKFQGKAVLLVWSERYRHVVVYVYV